MGRLEVVKFLVQEGGADVESKDKWGETALDRVRQEAAKGNWWNKERCRAVAAWLEKQERKSRILGKRQRRWLM